MDLFSELNTFCRRGHELELTDGEWRTYIVLVNVANEQHWPDVVSVPNARLMQRAGITSRETLRRRKARLESVHLIRFNDTQGMRSTMFRLDGIDNALGSSYSPTCHTEEAGSGISPTEGHSDATCPTDEASPPETPSKGGEHATCPNGGACADPSTCPKTCPKTEAGSDTPDTPSAPDQGATRVARAQETKETSSCTWWSAETLGPQNLRELREGTTGAGYEAEDWERVVSFWTTLAQTHPHGCLSLRFIAAEMDRKRDSRDRNAWGAFDPGIAADACEEAGKSYDHLFVEGNTERILSITVGIMRRMVGDLKAFERGETQDISAPSRRRLERQREKSDVRLRISAPERRRKQLEAYLENPANPGYRSGELVISLIPGYFGDRQGIDRALDGRTESLWQKALRERWHDRNPTAIEHVTQCAVDAVNAQVDEDEDERRELLELIATWKQEHPAVEPSDEEK